MRLDKSDQLFQRTANYYSRYRPDYPDELIKMIMDEYQDCTGGNMLDLGCGTGQLAFALHSYFLQITAIDINDEMIEEAKRLRKAKGIKTISFKTMAAEELNPTGNRDLIVCGNAFHWMDREKVLETCYESLRPGGGMVILAGRSIWNGNEQWQKKIVEVIQKWLGENRRAGGGTYADKSRLHEDFIENSAFTLVAQGEYLYTHEWTVDTIIGNLYSTSFCNKSLLDDKAEAFETELRKELLQLNPTGEFQERMEITYFFLRKKHISKGR
ncbi:class I SAM-dependent methyltransferase [Pseudalkalibacillus caeni]|uniref:Class I SAM-dependent methyltransferase n=1 Tax=Exobacillus caeni TaxID=2574798 RepID=A0A5R9F6F7_9BACL|nr:class I SAM-dependent methyltransferase [Pseudalkalibacillus caeni]TLS35375.1 class I SAM-dependent methyltransferase [Pseudalkalibacillus caeni]